MVLFSDNPIAYMFVLSLPHIEFLKYKSEIVVLDDEIEEILYEASRLQTKSIVCNNLRVFGNSAKLLKYIHKECIYRDIAYQKHLKDVDGILEKWKGKYTYLKGININYFCHNMKLGERNTNDYDILTTPKVASEMFAYLDETGWSKDYKTCNRDDYNECYSQHLTPFYKQDKKIYIEIHPRMNLPFDKYQPDIERFLGRCRWIDLYNSQYLLNSIEDCAYSLAFDMYVDQFYVHTYSLKTYSSIVALYKKINLERLYRIACNDNCLFPVSYALYCVNYMYKYSTGHDLMSNEEMLLFKFQKNIECFQYIKHHMTFSDATLGKWDDDFPLEKRIYTQVTSLNPETQALLDKKIAHYFFRRHWIDATEKLPLGYFDMYSDWEYVRPIIRVSKEQKK